MNLLLDTHTVIWFLENNPTLSKEALEAIQDENNIIFVSAVTAWEITVKKAIGKLKAPDNLQEELESHYFEPLSITMKHCLEVGNLPPYHQDPFDRLLIAQSKVESLTLVTRDSKIHEYNIKCIKA